MAMRIVPRLRLVQGNERFPGQPPFNGEKHPRSAELRKATREDVLRIAEPGCEDRPPLVKLCPDYGR